VSIKIIPGTPTTLIISPGTLRGTGHLTGRQRRLAAADCISREAKNRISSEEKPMGTTCNNDIF